MSQTQVEEATEGNATYIRQAILELQISGHLTIANGPRNSKLITLIAPFRTTPSDPVPTPSGRGQSPPRPPGSPLTGETGSGTG